MSESLTEVWRVNDLIHGWSSFVASEAHAKSLASRPGFEVTRLPLATPEQIRVLEMADQLVSVVDAFDEAARTQPFSRSIKAQHVESYTRAVDDVIAAARAARPEGGA